MVPFPRLHFFSVALAPLSSATGASYRVEDASDLVQQLFTPSNASNVVDLADQKANLINMW